MKYILLIAVAFGAGVLLSDKVKPFAKNILPKKKEEDGFDVKTAAQA